MSHDSSDVRDAQKRAAFMHRQQEMGGKFTYPEGTHEFRFLPTPRDKERKSPAIYQEYLMHYDVGPNKRPARCGDEPGEVHGTRCWLGREQRRLIKKGKT